MIFSDRQLAVAERELEKLRDALAMVNDKEEPDSEWLHVIEKNALRSQISDMEIEIQEYVMLRDGQVSFSERYSLSDLPRILVQARIAKGLSQSDLAAALNMKPQQVQRYEASDFMGASLARLIEVSEALGVRISESFATDGTEKGAYFTWANLNDVDWNKFPGKEMVQRGWFALAKGQSLVEGVRSFFEQEAGPQFATALHRKKVRGTNLPDEFALLAWQARVLQVANRIVSQNNFPHFSHDESWLSELVQLTNDEDGPLRAKRLLEQQGIVLVIEPHLPGSYLDGAAMMSVSGHPVIGMTLRFDRLDNFWFVLFHELAHVLLHLFDNMHIDFFDDDSTDISDVLEQEADQWALNTLIPEDQWNLCLSRFAVTEEAVKVDARKLSVHESIIAGRIRKELNNYTVLTNLVGQDLVRTQFEDVDT